MSKYRVECWHNVPVYRKGDLEEDTQYSFVDFSLRKDAKEHIENKLKALIHVRRDYHKGPNSWCVGFTTKKWINENTGEECQEFYKFKLSKI